MGKLSGYHRYLFLGKITGSLTEAEQQELDALFATDEHAVREFEQFTATLPPGDVSRSFDYLNQQDFWQGHLPREIRRQQSIAKRKTILLYTAAAVLVLAIIPIVFWNRWFSEPGRHTAKTVSTGSVLLTLANGETIDLNNRTGDIEAAGTRFNNRHGQLVLPAAVNAGTSKLSVTVPVGKDYQITLSDGSQVWLNAATRFDFTASFAAQKREVTISGEAYLQVSKDAARPFIVHLPQSDIEVTGTAFNVNSYSPDLIKCALVEGGVVMKTANASIQLTPGNQALLNTSNHSFTKEPFNAKKELSWRTGLYYFESATLDDISIVLARWFGIRTKIETPGLKTRKFAGILNKNEPIEDFVDNMRNISRIKIFFDKEGVLHFQ